MAGAARFSSPACSPRYIRYTERRRSISLPRPFPSLPFLSGVAISTNGPSSRSSSSSFRSRPALVAVSFSSEVDPRWHHDDGPTSIELELIASEERFDRIIAEAQQLEEGVIILWTASWCRRCIYLKPKIEKLAAEYHLRIRFYCVDVNSVPQRLVNRAGVTKMPTIQLWKDCKKQSEIFGGHKAYLVVNEVRQMIENQYN